MAFSVSSCKCLLFPYNDAEIAKVRELDQEALEEAGNVPDPEPAHELRATLISVVSFVSVFAFCLCASDVVVPD
jgi:hypothetical protein